ncbi:MAG: response regulator [Leptolyngbyaceae bacterium]|nr:response regulator [Leptolyngbyaceae bacterium]
MPPSEPLLVVEDSNADFNMLKRVLRKMDVQSPIHRCETGDETLAFMSQSGKGQSSNESTRPAIILLDLNLPGTDGRVVLTRLKQDEAFACIPIIVLTTSTARSDIEYCYQHGANGYLVKPMGKEAFQKMIQAFVDYWLGANTSPFLTVT